MAAPHVAGAAALVRSVFPKWTVQQVKAALMDTAGSGVRVANGGGSGTAVAPPMRAGSGMLQADQAISTSVLAYSDSDPSAVSLSFGTVPVTTSTLSVVKNLRVQNLSAVPTSYTVAFQPASVPAGVTISVASRVVAMAANTSVTIPVTLTIDPTKIKLTPDPTKTMVADSSWNTWIAEASGWVQLSPSDGRGADLRVSVYAAPRRASTMAAASSGTVTSAAIGTGTLALSGNGFAPTGTTSGSYDSLLTASELQATSAQLPLCAQSSDPDQSCLPFSDESAADIRYVGTSSEAPYCNHGVHGIETCQDSSGTFDVLLNVAITTWGAWRTPSSFAQFYVFWDVNGDHTPDALTVNTRLSLLCADDTHQSCDTDQLIAQTYLPCQQSSSQCDLELSDGSIWRPISSDGGAEPLNAAGGALETSPYDSDAIVLPVALNSLELAGWDSTTMPQVQYWVTSSTVESSAQVTTENLPLGPIDTVASPTAPLRVTVASPALSAVGDGGFPELNSDRAGTAFALKLRENSAALLTDLPAGTPSLLLIHHDNLNGARAQVVTIRRTATASIKLSATSITTSTRAKVAVTVAPAGATGQASCRDGTKILVTVNLVAGKATCTLPTLAKGTHSINAVYLGNAGYAPVRSNLVTVTVH
jgi:hypothetical protein